MKSQLKSRKEARDIIVVHQPGLSLRVFVSLRDAENA